MKKAKLISVIMVVATISILVLFGGKIFENNEAGKFHIKRAFITGNIRVIDEPGVYGQWFGKIFEYQNVATIGFGKEVGEGSADIDAIDVIFNDGSKATNSGLVRIKLPPVGQRESLLSEYSKGYDHFINAGILPVVRNAVKLSANLRSAQDAYTTLAVYQQCIQDQLEHGAYITYSSVDTIINATGDFETKQVTKIKLDENGVPMRKPNRLQELGCEVLECVIDVPVFDETVEKSIAKRKDEAMETELSKQKALRAKQEAITEEQQGLANVAKAKYEKEVEKIKEVTEAEKKFEVEKLAALTAKETAKKVEAEGLAKAAANRALVSAGLTPLEKATIDKETAIGVAAELAKRPVPYIVMDGAQGGASLSNSYTMENMILMMDKVSKMSKPSPNK